MSKKKKPAAKKKTAGSFTPIWVRVVAIGCAALLLATAVPLVWIFLR